MTKQPSILPQPTIPFNDSGLYKWLAGKGAGSWFKFIVSLDCQTAEVIRFSPIGSFECSTAYHIPKMLDLKLGFEITYPSHCMTLTVFQNSIVFELTKSQTINNEQ